MKKITKMLSVAALSIAAVACGSPEKMAKMAENVTVKCNPAVLEVVGGEINADVTVTYPEDYFHPKAVLKVTPVIVYEGGEAKMEPFMFQGEKVQDNYQVIPSDGTTITKKVSFDYVPGMEKSYLELRGTVKYKEKSIYDILEMTVDEGVEFFENMPKILRKLKTLQDVGLGYIKIGQSATTLSGGEAQRVKLATELSKRSTGKTIYILDEPTTGLHNADIHKLTDVLQKLVDNGNTVLVIEHNLGLIKVADHIIDIGPEGGDNGGEIIFTGTPVSCSINSTYCLNSTGKSSYLRTPQISQFQPANSLYTGTISSLHS